MKHTNFVPRTLLPFFLFFASACSEPPNVPAPVAALPQQPQQQPMAAQPEEISEPASVQPETAPWPPQKGDDAVSVDMEGMLADNYYVILDISGSMSGQKLKIAKEALRRFVSSIPDDVNIGFGFLGGKVGELVPIGKNNKTLILEKMARLKAGGGTPLAEAIADVGYQKLTEQAQRQLGYGEYHLVVITDGEADDIPATENAVNRVLDETPIVIHTIGFQIGEKHCLNQPGRILYKTADDLASLEEALSDVLAEAPEFDATFE